MVAVEALVRWDHPDLGLLGPDAFLRVAEESGLVVPMDAWVRRRALEQAASWAAGGSPVRIAVNLSTRDLHNPLLSRQLEREMSAAGLAPHLVELEITDRVAMSSEDLPAVLAGLRRLGVRLAIDDFGTGNSVLGRIQACPVDTLKIDRSFVERIRGAGDEAPVVRAVVALARSLGMAVLAEGVERQEQEKVLARYGCDLGQGFLYGRPLPPDRLGDLLALPVPR